MSRVFLVALTTLVVGCCAVATAAEWPAGPAAASRAGKKLKTGAYKGKTSQGFALNFAVVPATSSRCSVPDPPRRPQGRFCFLPTGDPKIEEPCSNGIVFHNYVLGLFTYVLTPQGTLKKTSHTFAPPDPKPVGTSVVALTIKPDGPASGYLRQSSELFIPADPAHPAQCNSGKVTFAAKRS